ncbi:MAG TPA: hypothetical protein VNO86_05735 [Candidatus Binatia bacterium]|nr:hypothetical protein [Candidatus Binatia bacterium]
MRAQRRRPAGGPARGGVRRLVRPLLGVVLVVALGGSLAGCGIAARQVTPPPASPTPAPSISVAIGLTRYQVAGALAAIGVPIVDAPVPYRPGESPRLAAAPRLVVQAVVPDAPSAGFIVIYEFVDGTAATAAAEEMVRYVASGPGQVQFPTDARFVLRQVGSTLVFYVWSPGAAPSPTLAEIATALGAVGQGYEVRR